MATNYPVAKDDSTSLPVPSASSATNSPSHSALHANANLAIIAVENKLGTGSSVAAANTLLLGTGAGTTSWTALTSAQLASVLSDETGTGSAVFATTPTLVTPKVDTINEATLSNGVTVAGVNMKSGALTTNSSVPTAALQSSAVTSDKVATGMPVQLVSTNYSAVATGTTIIPADDTIPQITEGDQYMTQAITPKSTTNRLSIEVTMLLANTFGVADMTVALFQDTTANALAATAQTSGGVNYVQNIKLTHDMITGTISSTTFKVRAGLSSAGTTTFNGQVSTRRYGGITVSNIRITEYKA